MRIFKLIWKFLKKFWLYLVALVVLIGFFPQIKSLLSQISYKINPTFITIAEIRGIKELISAEYYGETVHSLFEQYLLEINNALKKWSDVNTPSNNLDFTEYTRLLILFSVNDIYSVIHDAINNAGVQNRFRQILNSRNQWISANSESIVNGFAWIKSNNTLFNNIMQRATSILQENSNGSLSRRINRFVKNSELAYLARGWVKAGIDLSDLDDKDKTGKIDDNKCFLCQKHGTLYLQIDIKVLYNEINPYFIYTPDCKIDGYYVLKDENINLTRPEDILKVNHVKDGCHHKLENEAIELELLPKAKESAEQTLARLLSVLPLKDRDKVYNISSIVIVPTDEISVKSFMQNQCRCEDVDWKNNLKKNLKVIDYWKLR